MSLRRTLPVLVLPVALVAALAFRWLGAVPIWDGLYYYDCVLRATAPPYPASAFVCADHPPAYLFLAGWPQYLFHGSALALNLANLAWLLFGIAGYARLIEVVAPEASRIERTLAVSAFASAPLVLAVTLHFAADEGLLVFLPWVLDGFVRRRLVQTLAAGVLLVLSKEPGIALYGVAWVGAVALERPTPRRAATLLAPLAPALLYLALRWLSGVNPVNTEATPSLGRNLLAGVAFVAVLSFAWVAWLLPAAGWVVSRLRRAPSAPWGDAERYLWIVAALSMAALGALVPFHNARYFAAALVPLLAAAYGLLRRVTGASLRIAFLLGLVGLQLAAQYDTLDPVSSAAFGRAPWGTMRLHCRFLEEAEGCRGRDQLVYNQQFLELGKAQDALFQELRPSSDATFVVAPDATYLMHTPLDPATFAKTLRGGSVLTPRVVTVADLEKADDWPETLYVLNYPRLGFTGLPKLQRRYDVTATATYGTARFRIPVTTLKRRGPA